MEHTTQHTTEHTIEDSTQDEHLFELDDKQLSHVSGGIVNMRHEINVTHELKLPTFGDSKTRSQRINDGLHGSWMGHLEAKGLAKYERYRIRRHAQKGLEYEVNRSWADRLSAKV